MDKNCKTKLSYALAGFCSGALVVALAFWLPSKMFSPQSRLVSMMQDITEICEDNMSTPREGDEQLLEYLTKNAPGAAQHIVQIICNGAAMTRDGDREEYFNEVSSELQKEIKNTSGAVLRMYSKLDGSSEVMDRFRSLPDIGTLTNPQSNNIKNRMDFDDIRYTQAATTGSFDTSAYMNAGSSITGNQYTFEGKVDNILTVDNNSLLSVIPAGSTDKNIRLPLILKKDAAGNLNVMRNDSYIFEVICRNGRDVHGDIVKGMLLIKNLTAK